MRLTVGDTWPFWRPVIGRSVLVFCDDKLITCATTANEDLGFVYHYAANERGENYYDPLTKEAAQTIAYGSVSILLKPNATAAVGLLFEKMREAQCVWRREEER